MEDKTTKTLLSFYRAIRSEETCTGDVGNQYDLAVKLMHLMKKEALIEDAINIGQLVGAKCVKISSDTESFGTLIFREVLDLRLNFEELADGTEGSGWVTHKTVPECLENIFDAPKVSEVQEQLQAFVDNWWGPADGTRNILDVPFKIYQDDPDETMREAKRHILVSDQKRILESLERDEGISTSRKKSRRRHLSSKYVKKNRS